jgi:calcium/calmodulin-dependent protein kinase I
MEYFPLGDLQAYLTSPLPETEVKQICFQILEGLDFMHRNGFAHRDLKPANILVKSHSPDWWVKIGDFGISKRAGEGLHALRTLSGTLGFMAPEVLVQHGLLDSAEFGEVREYTVAVDIWSLGEIIFRALTNEPPFPKGLASYIKEPSSYPFEAINNANLHLSAGKFVWNLLRAMPADRPTAEAALRHPWLASLHKPLPAAESTGSLQRYELLVLPENVHLAEPEWINARPQH